MYFQPSMYLPPAGGKPKLIFNRAVNNDDEDRNSFIHYLKGRGSEPVFEYLVNNGQMVKLYFDDDFKGDANTNLDEISLEEFNIICDKRNTRNIKIIEDHFHWLELDISISSYNGKDLSEDSPHYQKRKISFHYIISNVKGTISDIKQLAIKFGFDQKVYKGIGGKQQLFRLGKTHKYPKSNRRKGDEPHRKPRLLTNKKDIFKHILQYVTDDMIEYSNGSRALEEILEEEMKEQKEEMLEEHKEENEEEHKEENEEALSEDICAILKDLPPRFCNDYNDWLTITLYYKQFGNYNDWCKWCRKCPRYDPSWDSKNKQLWEDRPVYNGDGKKEIEKLLNPLTEARAKLLFKLFNGSTNDASLVDDILNQYRNYFKVISYKKDEIYVFDRDTLLWVSISKDYLNTYLTKYWFPHLVELSFRVSSEKFGKYESPINSKWFGILDRDVYKKALQCFLQNINSMGNTKTKNNFKMEFFLRKEIQDEKFKHKLNIEPHILSVKGGKINLKTKEFKPRLQADNLSYELDLEYSPEAKNKEFEEFLLNIFTPVVDNLEGKWCIDYLQRYLGYAITGETKAEKILVLMGTGSNGKSKLFSILQNVLKANVDLVGVWNADLFNENISSNNVNNASPEIAKLYGKRLGFINESKGSTVWGETFKKLVDSGSLLTARELYGASFEFNLSTTFVMCSNEFPNFPIDYCYTRRIDTLNLVNRYVDMEDRAITTPNDKPIDINIINKVCGSKELRQGVLNWLIQGAFDYYRNGLLSIPPSQQIKKEEYISGNDWFKNFTITKDKKDYIPVNSVYENINLLTSCRVKKQEMINRFIENGAKLSRKELDGKRVPILRYVIDNIEDEDPECNIEEDGDEEHSCTI